MREDMAKVIVERPRHGGGFKTPKGSVRRWQRYPMEEWLSREGMKRPWKNAPKFLNENLAPLKRFLRSALGRPWNAVQSEMRERINLNSAVQLHIWQHVEQFVEVHVYERDGQLIDSRGCPLHGYFYVDPVTGLLCEVPHGRALRKKKRFEYIVIDALNQYRKLNGIWYQLQLKPFPVEGYAWDVVYRCPCSASMQAAMAQYYGRHAYACRKRQLNTREIRDLLRQHPRLAKHR